MNTQITLRLLILITIVFLPYTSMPADASDSHQAGIDAFNSKEYEQALKYFKTAEAEGIETPNLIYNLAVTCYKLEKYQKAEQGFLRLTDNPDWRHLAFYNLGLVAEAKGDRQAAVNYYIHARQAAKTSRINQLAAVKIEELRPHEPGPVPGKWVGMASVSAGYDDNAVLAPDKDFAEISDKSDIFTEFYGFGSVYLAGDKHDGLRFSGDGFARLYAHESDYSFAAFSAAAARDKQYDTWHTSVGVNIGAEFADTGLFSFGPSLKLIGERKLSESLIFELSNRLHWIEGGSEYDYLTGLKNRLTAKLNRKIPAGNFYSEICFEYNNRTDYETQQGEFLSYSPLRAEIGAGMNWMPAPGLTLVFYGQYRKSLYPDAHRISDQHGSSIVKKREDDRILISVRIEYMLTQSIDVFAQYTGTDNDSNLPGYGYESNRMMLGVQKLFF